MFEFKQFFTYLLIKLHNAVPHYSANEMRSDIKETTRQKNKLQN